MASGKRGGVTALVLRILRPSLFSGHSLASFEDRRDHYHSAGVGVQISRKQGPLTHRASGSGEPEAHAPKGGHLDGERWATDEMRSRKVDRIGL